MIINPIIQSGGGLKSQIVVTAPTGSTVTCTTPGGIVIQGLEVSGTWTFSDLPGFGTYTITASLGSQSETESVVVDKVAEYRVAITYRLYLYNLGDECTDVTSGWEFSVEQSNSNTWDYYVSQQGTRTKKKNADNIELSLNSTSSGQYASLISAKTIHKISFAGYNKLLLEVDEVGKLTYVGAGGSGGQGARIILQVWDKDPASDIYWNANRDSREQYTNVAEWNKTRNLEIYVNTLQYVNCYVVIGILIWYAQGYETARIKKVWLE